MTRRLLFFGCFLASFVAAQEWFDQEEVIRRFTLVPTSGLIEKYQYPARVFKVTTDDDYILEMHRIPYSVKSPAAPDKPVVFLQHGLFGSSADWVMMGPDKDLAYMLVDLGYDVWMGNSRGNIYSKLHENLSPNSSSYWQFSFHEMGMFDLPAEIDYVLDKTGQEQLFYVGHSQGTTQFYVMASERPEYNDKIKAMFSLAPMAFMDHAASPFLHLLELFDGDKQVLTDFLGNDSFTPSPSLYETLGEAECNETAMSTLMCQEMVFLIGGFDSRLLNLTMLPVITKHYLTAASTKQLIHYAQEVKSALFRQYDYHRDNPLHYDQPYPPEYELGKITCPVALHYSDNDLMSHPKDVDRLYDQLANPIGKFLVPHKDFNHLDFLWAIDAKKLLYNKIVDLMSSYS